MMTTSSNKDNNKEASNNITTIIHPLVLLSIVDHYERSKLVAGKRIVGILLGTQTSPTTVNITNSYAVPFEEGTSSINKDNDDSSTVWYLDHDYHEAMAELCKKVSAKEVPIGWYSSGPSLRPSDQLIHDQFIAKHQEKQQRQGGNSDDAKQSPFFNPILAIVNPAPPNNAPPTIQSYHLQPQINKDGSVADRTWTPLPTLVEGEEAEEIGVEHLLRDISPESVGSLGGRGEGRLPAAIATKLASLQTLRGQLDSIRAYLGRDHDRAGKSVNILEQIQSIYSTLPTLSTTASDSAEQRAGTIKSNDQLTIIYVNTLVKTMLALDKLVDNKLCVCVDDSTNITASATQSSS